MRVDTMKRQIDLHAWVGIVAGLALFVAFFAGAINMFHHELHHWQEPWQAQTADTDVDMQALLDTVIASSPEAGNWLFLIPGDEPAAIWHESVDGKDVWHTDHASDFNDAGDRVEQPRSELAGFINELHYRLALPGVGLYLMGIISVLYGAALIGGLVIHWPKLKKEFFALKHQGNLRRYWKNLHNLVGVISFPFHLIFAVTGAAMGCFAIITLLMGALVFGPQFQGAMTEATEAWPTAEASGTEAPMAGADRYVAAARERVPELRVDWIEFQQYGDKNATIDVAGSVTGTVAHHAHVVVRATDAEVLNTSVPGARPFNHFILSPIYSLHFGDYGGLFLRLLYFVLGLLGCLLFVSGNIMWSERRTDRRGPSRSAAIMLRVTLGVTFGVMAGIAISFMANKLMMYSPWPGGTVLAEKGGFGVTLLVALAAAFRFPPLSTARVWLPLCAALYVLAPVLQGVIEGFASWADPDRLLVNGSLLAIAASLFLVDRLRAHRLRQAGPHPLWDGTVHTVSEPSGNPPPRLSGGG